MNEEILTQANEKANDQGLSSFKSGFKYHEAFIYWCIKEYPNDKKLGEYIRKVVTTGAKDNPYNEYIDSISIEVNKIFKNK